MLILVPAVGTVPGFTDEELVEIVKVAHANDALVLSAIGTSQEGSSREVIEQIAIRNKVAGVDIQHNRGRRIRRFSDSGKYLRIVSCNSRGSSYSSSYGTFGGSLIKRKKEQHTSLRLVCCSFFVLSFCL